MIKVLIMWSVLMCTVVLPQNDTTLAYFTSIAHTDSAYSSNSLMLINANNDTIIVDLFTKLLKPLPHYWYVAMGDKLGFPYRDNLYKIYYYVKPDGTKVYLRNTYFFDYLEKIRKKLNYKPKVIYIAE